MSYIVSVIVGYLFGCIQTGYLVGKIFLKKDIRELGNGNAGASNATLVFGKRFGIITALVDISKGLVSVFIIRTVYQSQVSEGILLSLIYINGLCVILGHNFPFYLSFKGGKGTASLIGILFALDLWVGLIGLLCLILFVLVTDYIVIGTMGLLGVLLGNSLLFHRDIIVLFCVISIVFMSVYKHRKNFVNIKNGTEKHVRKSLSKYS